jgi:hypothetical protein
MSDRDPPRAKVDYTGFLFAAILAPVFLFFIYLGRADMGLAVFIVLAMAEREGFYYRRCCYLVVMPTLPS